MTAILDARPTTENCILHHCAVVDLHQHVAAESVDWIFTDPPYPREYLPCFGELADFAAHALKPGGGLMVMSGTMHLPDVVMGLMSNSVLRYWWTLAYDCGRGDRAVIWPRRVLTGWKPVFWFVKGEYTGKQKRDLLALPPMARGRNNDHHHWGQPVGQIYQWVSEFASSGDVVCDPFLGGGSTAVAALDLRCRFIGADIDADCIRITRERLTDRLF